MKAFVNWYKGVDSFIKFLFYAILVIAAIAILARGYYKHQINIPQEIPEFATTGGVVDEAIKRYLKISLTGGDPDWDYNRIFVDTSPEEKAHVGTAGFFIYEDELDVIDYYINYTESWGQSCETASYGDFLKFSDGILTYQIFATPSSEEAKILCKVELPDSITAFEVIISQGADEKLYYVFKEVTLPVKYILNFE